MSDRLYDWPESARVAGLGRVIPKTKFYEHAKVAARVRQYFVDEVQRIRWSFKLSEETVRLRPTRNVSEIQIFSLDLKGPELNPAVLATIDKAIPKPIIFELNHGDPPREIRMFAAWKPGGSGNPKPGDYTSTEWLTADTERSALPTALDLASLYEALVTPLLPVTVGKTETIEAALVRTDEIRRLRQETTRLEKQMRTEPQFNRRVDLRRQLKAKTAELARLNDPTPQT